MGAGAPFVRRLSRTQGNGILSGAPPLRCCVNAFILVCCCPVISARAFQRNTSPPLSAFPQPGQERAALKFGSEIRGNCMQYCDWI